ncbi:MAG: hypothetical protein Q9225_000773 [Loekoesia sp. 1 TL-2023]
MECLERRDALPNPTSDVESSGTALLETNGSSVFDTPTRRGGKKRSLDDSSQSSDQSNMQESKTGSPSSRRNKLRLLASKTKEATKRLLNAPDQQERSKDLPQNNNQPLHVLESDAAFNLGQLDTEHRSEKRVAAKIQVNMQAVAAGIMHPKRGVKGKATRSTAGRLSRIERPYLSKNMDIELLEAHDNLSRAQSVASSARETSKEEAAPWSDDCKERVQQLEARRESLRAAYTTGRLVQRVRVVPKRHIDLPGAGQFLRRDKQRGRMRHDWLKWIGYVSALTYAYVIYIVVRNRYFPSSVKALRESIRRSHDQQSRAYKFGELVDKHGRHHWIEPLLDQLGPYVQLQLNDLVNILEVFAKYRYLVSPFKWALWDIPTDAEWSFQYLRRNAQITREQLVKQRVDQIYQEKNDGDRAPRYQGIMRMIPDVTAEEDDSDKDDDWHSASSTTSVLEGTDIIAYRAYSQGLVGRLIIYSDGVRFVRSVKRKELWRRSFLELAEMRKKEGSLVSRLPGVSSQSLELNFIDGSKLALEGMKDRDSAFNTVIGFSGLQWQSLPAKTIEDGIHDDAVPAS